MLGAAAFWLSTANPVIAATPNTGVPCPVAAAVFAPPLDQPLLLTRQIIRTLEQGEFRQTVTYRLRFTRAGRGYRLQWQQIGQQSQGPAELLRLLALEADSAQGEALDFTLGENGELLGVTEAPDAAQRLADALERLRADPAMTARPPHEQAVIGQMFDRMTAMQPAERADLHMAKAVRLLVVAGRACSGRAIIGHDGIEYRLLHGPDAAGRMALASVTRDARPDGSHITVSNQITIAARTGLAEKSSRETTIRVRGIARSTWDVLELQPERETVGTTR